MVQQMSDLKEEVPNNIVGIKQKKGSSLLILLQDSQQWKRQPYLLALEDAVEVKAPYKISSFLWLVALDAWLTQDDLQR